MRKLALTAGVVTLVSVATACGTSTGTNGSGNTTLTIAVSRVATPWDLATAGLGDYIDYDEPVFDPLVRLDTKANVTPNLATSWSYDSTNTVLTMKLRTDVKFTDGTILDAEAVKANLLHNKQGTNEAAGKLKAITTVDVVDSATVAVHLSAPNPALLTSLGDASGMIASPKDLEAKNGPVGSGPYVLDKANTTNGSSYTFTRNPNYWNKKTFPFDKIVIKAITDPTARINALLAGQVDWARITPQSANQVKSHGLQVQSHVDSVEGLYIWDRAGKIVPALANTKVRQALNYAFDRASIVSKINQGFAKPTSQMFTPDSGVYDPALDSTYPYDPAKAKQLLAEAGYPNGFSVTMPDVSAVAPSQQAVMTQSLEDIGIKVKIDNLPSTELYTALQSGKYAMSWFKLASFQPWDFISTELTKGAVWNPAQDFDPQLAGLISQAQTANGDAQTALYKEINRYVQTNAFNAPWDILDAVQGNSTKIKVTAQPFVSAVPIYNMAPAS